jgi:hypothetical protein
VTDSSGNGYNSELLSNISSETTDQCYDAVNYKVDEDATPASFDLELTTTKHNIAVDPDVPYTALGIGSRTICMWIRPESFADYNTIFDFDPLGGIFGGTPGLTRCRLVLTSSNILRFAVNGAWRQYGTSTFSADTWYFITYTYNASSGQHNIYIDGVQDITHDRIVNDFGYTRLTIGAEYTGSTAKDGFFDGNIDNILIYDRVLSATEIDDLQAASFTFGGTVTHPIYDDWDTPDGASEYTTEWQECTWSSYRGYPSSCVFFEQRLCLASTRTDRQTVWMSQTDDYENFKAGANDSDSIAYTIASQENNDILWMNSHERLALGTNGGEFVVGTSSINEAISPSNIKIVRQSTYGSVNEQSVMINDATLFLQRDRRKVREFIYNFEKDGYLATDMTILASHITGDGVSELTAQHTPDTMLWCKRDDGDIVSMTYEKENNVIGWHEHTFSGDVETISVIPQADTDDQLWLVVNRTIDGATERHIEYMKPMKYDSTSDADLFYVDSGLTTSVTASNTVSGLDHLEGEVVAVIADGTVLYDGSGSDSDFTVTSGSITISDSSPTYTSLHAGLPYTAVIKTMPMSSGQALLHMRQKRISEVKTDYYNSGDFYIGKDTTSKELISITGNATGYDRRTFPPGYDQYGQVYLYQITPEPLTVLAIGMEFKVQ